MAVSLPTPFNTYHGGMDNRVHLHALLSMMEVSTWMVYNGLAVVSVFLVL